MDLLNIRTKTPVAKLVKPLPLVFHNASHYKPIMNSGDCESDPELIILNNQISRSKMPFNKNTNGQETSEEVKKIHDRQLLAILIQREIQILSETKQADSKVANVLKKLICKSDEPKNSSKSMTQLKKTSINKNTNYIVNCKSVKVNDIMKEVIECKLQVL